MSYTYCAIMQKLVRDVKQILHKDIQFIRDTR
jgi:hypothetical protein